MARNKAQDYLDTYSTYSNSSVTPSMAQDGNVPKMDTDTTPVTTPVTTTSNDDGFTFDMDDVTATTPTSTPKEEVVTVPKETPEDQSNQAYMDEIRNIQYDPSEWLDNYMSGIEKPMSEEELERRQRGALAAEKLNQFKSVAEALANLGATGAGAYNSVTSTVPTSQLQQFQNEATAKRKTYNAYLRQAHTDARNDYKTKVSAANTAFQQKLQQDKYQAQLDLKIMKEARLGAVDAKRQEYYDKQIDKLNKQIQKIDNDILNSQKLTNYKINKPYYNPNPSKDTSSEEKEDEQFTF